ncbi:MAG: glycogen/starch synthase, ADP-glucose type [Nevskia sp.]|nr:glycogen/starch synthase, ADP-glucose type [Nevskia sp.]
MKILHAAAECFPLAKTGGLGDVLGALPFAQRNLGADARVMLPAYRGVRQKLGSTRRLGELQLRGQRCEIFAGELPSIDGGTAARLPVLLFDCPALFDRDGGPYEDANGRAFADNAWRFGCFGEAVAQIASGAVAGFEADVVNLHDWQAALAAPRLSAQATRPRIVFTIHNLAYQGQFGRREFDALGLPLAWWQPDFLEFWGGFSFMKAGLNFSDAISTVSPTYAREIQTPAFGQGLDGVLRARAAILHGIANGIDQTLWNPATDPLIDQNYTLADVDAGKRANKQALLQELALDADERPLVAFIGRLAEQKGADLILAAREQLLALPAQYVVLAAGDPQLQNAFRSLAYNAPEGRIAVHIAHDERFAHRLTAAADLLLMPSRFEPCGLNQMYAQRYGTLPLVHNTGGLADTVVDATAATLADGSATGVQFRDADVGGVVYGVRRGLELLADVGSADRLRKTGMRRDFSWTRSAQRYLELYQSLIDAG